MLCERVSPGTTDSDLWKNISVTQKVTTVDKVAFSHKSVKIAEKTNSTIPPG